MFLSLFYVEQKAEFSNERRLSLSLQITDLDTEDSKKDTLVDVVFKKALKEFRLNIFNSYSTALAVSSQASHLITLFSTSKGSIGILK